MILPDREILIALDRQQIKIDPRPGQEALSSTSIDLTLSEDFCVWSALAGVPIRPGAPGYAYTNLVRLQDRTRSSEYTMNPKTFVLAWTKERVELPENSRLAGRVEGKSSLARLGVGVHVTAPTIHAGFRGQVQLELYNFGPHQIILDAGMRICQLILEQTLGTPEKGYRGMFSDQSSQTG